MADITGVLLAAGFSSRFGGNKLLQAVGGKPLISFGVAALGPCDRIIVVVREDDGLLALLSALEVDYVINVYPERGIGYSIACGVQAASQSYGWCVLPADMPLVQPAITQQLVDALRSGAMLTAPQYRGRRGHPVGFSQRFFSTLSALDGDLGARSIVEQYADQVTWVSSQDTSTLMDVDTVNDLERIVARMRAS
jgi:molybdenum cofactor cytidylyltransferase